VKILLGREVVNPDRPDERGQTPLSFAACSGHDGVVKILLGREDVNPNKPENRDRTSLLYATKYASWGVADYKSKGVAALLQSHQAVKPQHYLRHERHRLVETTTAPYLSEYVTTCDELGYLLPPTEECGEVGMQIYVIAFCAFLAIFFIKFRRVWSWGGEISVAVGKSSLSLADFVLLYLILLSLSVNSYISLLSCIVFFSPSSPSSLFPPLLLNDR